MRIPYASLEAFKAKANLLESLLKLKGRRRSLELLSQLSGYASYHEVSHTDLATSQAPTVDQVAAQLQATFPDLTPPEAHRVADALRLHVLEPRSGRTAKTAQEKKFDGLYVTKTPVDKKALLEFRFQKDGPGMLRAPSFDPAEQAAALKDLRTPLFYLRSHGPVLAHPDLPEIESDFFGGTPDYTPSDDELSEWWFSHIEYELYPKYTGQPAPELTDDESETLYNFWMSPSVEAAQSHVTLSRIPDIVRLAELWKPHHAEAYARISVSNSPAYAVLVGETPVPQGANWARADAQISCSLAFKESDAAELEKDDSMSIWEYSATFMLTSKGRARARPIALMTGTHIVPFKMRHDEFESAGSGYFADMMDAHSAMLNDVWKVLEFKYFPENDYADVDAFAWERMGAAFTVTSLEIAPELRGKDLAPLILNLFIVTVARYPASALDYGWARACGLSDADEDEGDDEGDAVQLGTPSVLILPVEGTAPERETLTPARLLLTQSPLMVQTANKDSDKEHRKKNLTAHFLAMDDKVEADIVVYDPWEYPTT